MVESAPVLTVLNPATEEPIAELEQAGVEETDAAVARAKAAFPAWRAVAPDRPRAAAAPARDARRGARRGARADRVAQRRQADLGRAGEIGMVAQVFHFYAGAVDKHYGETIPVAGGVDVTFREPLGVVGLIVPWNFPLNIASLEARPRARVRQHRRAEAGRADAAVARCGSPSSCSRRGSRRASSTSSSARARSSAARLVEHPDVAKIGFTGSTEVGRTVMAGRRGDDQARHARARRQVGERRLRRRRPRAGRRGRAVRRLRQRRPGLLRALADPRRAHAPTTASSSCSSRRRAA